jgi:Putative auto-transporter adhesin, head GIN domain
MIALIVGAVAAVLLQQLVFDGPSSSRIEGSGVAATEARSLPAFGRVDLAGANTVSVRAGRTQSVAVRADDNLLRSVTTRVQDGVLVVGTTGSFAAKAPMSVDIGVPSLEAVTLSGTGRVEVQSVRADRLIVRLSGSGVVRVSGSVRRLDVTIEGSGEAQLRGLAARHVRATVAGAGVIAVDARRTLDASIQGVGEIVYGGSPARVKTNIAGTGTVHPG